MSGPTRSSESRSWPSEAPVRTAQARAPLPSDAGTTYVKLFLDGLCLDVNPANKLTNVSIQQVRDIYLGNITSWTGIPGSGLTSTIDPFGRDTNGGTYNFFVSSV